LHFLDFFDLRLPPFVDSVDGVGAGVCPGVGAGAGAGATFACAGVCAGVCSGACAGVGFVAGFATDVVELPNPSAVAIPSNGHITFITISYIYSITN
jgi:hypothetical protein